MFNLTGKVAIVTGASRGIGKSIAVLLASNGATVVAAAREDHASETVAEITAAGGHAEIASLDVNKASEIEELVAATVKRHSSIDILINNAGIARDQLALRMKSSDWDAVIATNLTASFLCSQAVLKPMIRKRNGRIVNISSVVGQMGNAGQVNYAASKAGLIGLTKSLAREVASRNITVNAVTPGLIDTDMSKDILGKAQDSWKGQIPLGRMGTTTDVAVAVCFLVSDEASYITGQALAVNGGMYM
tara:strand:- start:708 stop:1448 length:741 start_codon:yes stop_codon:yes gene_type:complete